MRTPTHTHTHTPPKTQRSGYTLPPPLPVFSAAFLTKARSFWYKGWHSQSQEPTTGIKDGFLGSSSQPEPGSSARAHEALFCGFFLVGIAADLLKCDSLCGENGWIRHGELQGIKHVIVAAPSCQNEATKKNASERQSSENLLPLGGLEVVRSSSVDSNRKLALPHESAQDLFQKKNSRPKTICSCVLSRGNVIFVFGLSSVTSRMVDRAEYHSYHSQFRKVDCDICGNCLSCKSSTSHFRVFFFFFFSLAFFFGDNHLVRRGGSNSPAHDRASEPVPQPFFR